MVGQTNEHRQALTITAEHHKSILTINIICIELQNASEQYDENGNEAGMQQWLHLVTVVKVSYCSILHLKHKQILFTLCTCQCHADTTT